MLYYVKVADLLLFKTELYAGNLIAFPPGTA